MIRPITVICWILALSAGLYLYRAKHEVELMDKHIEQIAKETGDVRAQSRHLLDDWIRLGEPEQLHKYSDEYLGLKTIAPTQFARLSDLPGRLPAPAADPVPEPADVVADGPAAATPDAAPGVVTADGVDEADGDALPVPPIPPTTPMLTQVSLPAGGPTVGPVPLQARPVTPRIANSDPDQRPRAEPRVAEEPRAVPKPLPAVVSDTPGIQAHDLPPLQAQRAQLPAPASPPYRQPVPAQQAQSLPPLRQPGQGLPPIQAQGPSRQDGSRQDGSRQDGSRQDVSRQDGSRQDVSRQDGPASQPPARSYAAEPVGRPVPWNDAPRVANDNRAPRLAEPGAPRPTQQATAPMRYQPGYPTGYPAGYPTGYPTGPNQSGSLLGTASRPPAPLPLPAPTPVTYPRPYPALYGYPAQYPGGYPAPAPYPYGPGR
jgi:hypothetical protein